MPTLSYKGNYSKVVTPVPNVNPLLSPTFQLGSGMLLDNLQFYLVNKAHVFVTNANGTTEEIVVDCQDPFVQRWWETAKDGFGANRITAEQIGPESRVAQGCLLGAGTHYAVESLAPLRDGQTVTQIILRVMMFAL